MKTPAITKIGTNFIKYLTGLSLLLAADQLANATDRTWTGGAGTTVMNTGGNWSGGVAPTTTTSDRAIWDGTVQTNVPYAWSGGFGSGNAGGMAIVIGAGYTNSSTIIGNGTGNLAGLSNIVVSAGAGSFVFGDTNGAIVTGTVWRSGGTNGFINNSTNVGTIAPNVLFNNGSGTGRSMYLIGSWNVFSAIQPDGSGAMTPIVDGNGANTVTLNAAGTKNSQGWTINNGTVLLTQGDALAVTGTQTLTIGGGAGVKTLALSNSISLNAAVANINIAGRTDVIGAANASILSLSGDNAINGTVRFNAAGGTNVLIYAASGTLNLAGSITAGTVTGARNFMFDGAGTTYVNGVIANGSATVGLRLEGGGLVLNNANTFSGITSIDANVLTVGNNLALQNSTVVVNGGKLDLNGGNGVSPTVGGLSGTGVVDTLSGGASTLSVGNNNAPSTFNGNITNSSGTVSLQKIGTNTFTLAGASGYNGGTIVANGTLLINNTVGSGTGSGNVVVSSGARLGGTGTIQGNVDWQSGSSGSFSVNPTTAVSGSNSTPLTVSGNLNLNDNAVTIDVPGAAPLAAGTYKLASYNNAGSLGSFGRTPNYTGSGAELGTASIITMDNGAVTLNVVLTGVPSSWTNNIASGNWSGGTNWSSNPYFPHVSGDAARLGQGSAYTTVLLDVDASVGTIVFTNANSFFIADAGKTLTLDSPLAGTVISVQNGSSNAIGSAVLLNTNLSIMTAAGATLAITNTISNGNGIQTLAISGPGTVALAGNNTYGTASGTVGTTLSGGVLQLGNNNALGAGDLSVPNSSTIQAGVGLTLAKNIIGSASTTTTFDNNGKNVTLLGIISGAASFIKTGAGTLTLNNANTYTGDSTFNAGTVLVGAANVVPGGAGNGNVTVSTNATFDLHGNVQTINGLNGAGIVDSSSGSATLTLGENNAGGTFSGAIKNASGSLALVKDGTGTQILAGTNSYSGGTTINTGILQVGNGGTNGSVGTGPVVLNSGLTYNLTGTNSITNTLSGAGTLTINNTNLTEFLTGNNPAFSGNIHVNQGHLWITNLAAVGPGPKTITVDAAVASLLSELHLAGNIEFDSSISFVLTYFGGVLINESGTNQLDGSIQMPNGGGNPYINVKSGFLTLAGPITTVAGSNPRTLTLGGVANGLVSGGVNDAGGVAASVAKVDAGTWTMTGDNSYSGGTTVSNGTFLINGNKLGAAAVTVLTNATFGGTGYVQSGVTWQLGSAALFTLTPSGGANATPFSVAGTATLNNNNVTINVPGSTPLTAGAYTLMTYNATGSSGAFAGTPVITGAGLPTNTLASVLTGGGVVALLVQPSFVWTNNGSGNWTTGTNWNTNPNVPGNAGDVAIFGVGSNLTTVNLNASENVGGLSFTNNNSFVITNSANSLTLNNNGLGAIINVTRGSSNAIVTPVSLSDNTSVSIAAGQSLALSGNVTGGGALTKNGNGILTLSASNDFSGITTVNGGVLALGSTNAIGPNTLIISGGSLDSIATNLVNANNNAQTWNTSLGFVGSQNLNLGTGAVTLGNNVTVTVNNKTLAVGGAIDGAFGLTIQGTNNGTLELDGANTFTGGLIISNGVVAIGNDSAFGTGTLHLGLTSGAGGGTTIRSTDSTPHTIANLCQANVSVPNVFSGTGDLTFSGTVATGNGAKTFIISNSVTTFSGPVTDNGAPIGPIIVAGSGRLVISGANTLTKSFQINAATLALGSTTAIGTGTLVINGGALDSTVADLVNANNNPQSWNGSFGFAGSQNLDLGIGGVTMTTNTTVTVSNNTLTVGGTISGGANSLTKAGAGKLVVNGANAYGNTTVNAGTLEIAQATLKTNSVVTVSSGAVLQLDFNTTNQIALLSFAGVNQAPGVYKAGNSGGLITGTGSLLVVPMPVGVGRLTNSVSGQTLSLAWPANQGWRLQMQTNPITIGLSNNWFYVTDGSISSTNLAIDPSTPTVFYRLRYP